MRQRSSWIVVPLLCIVVQLGTLTGCTLVSKPVITNPLSQVAPPPTGTVAFLQEGDIWVYDETGQQAQVVLAAEPDVIHGPTFLPDSSGILYVQQNQAYYELWLYQLTTQTTEFITATPILPQHLAVSPNSRFVLVTLDQTLFLIDLDSKTQTRLHEGVTDYAWSPNSRRLIYQTIDDRLLSRSFSVTSELDEPAVILTQALRSPVFLSDRELLLEALNAAGRYTVMRYTIDTGESVPLTSLDFAEPALSVRLRLSPNQEQLLYIRSADDGTTLDTWLIHLSKDAPKLLVQESTAPVWSEDGSALYYVTAAHKLYTIAATGLNKNLISPVGTAVTTTVNQGSNEIAL